jgi:glycerol-3-phosphate dehydrogenase
MHSWFRNFRRGSVVLTSTVFSATSFCEDSHPCPHPAPRKIAGKQGKVVFASELLAETNSLQSEYDVVIIGAGVVGCAIAYRLSLLQNLRTIVIDQNLDVGEGTSKANSAIVHTGFDAEPATLESQLLQQSSAEWPELARDLKIPFKQIGALLIARDENELKELKKVVEKSYANNVTDVKLLSKTEILEMEPNLTSHCLGGVLIPRESITDPFGTVIAYAETAIANQTDFCMGAYVTNINHFPKKNEIILQPSARDFISPSIKNSEVKIKAKWVINAAGLGSRDLAQSYDKPLSEKLTLNPRRGQFIILARPAMVNHIVLPLPNELTKGILVSPTIFGNTLCGPTAEDLPSTELHTKPKVTQQGLEQVMKGASELVPKVQQTPTVTTYAGHRCHRKEGTYFIQHDKNRHITTISGIRSTGLSTSPALSQKIAEDLFPRHERKPDAITERENWPVWYRRQEQRASKSDSSTRNEICEYEHVTADDVREAINSPLRPHTLDSIKRRTRALAGVCQGSDCQEEVAKIIAKECGINVVTKCGCGSDFSLDIEKN